MLCSPRWVDHAPIERHTSKSIQAENHSQKLKKKKQQRTARWITHEAEELEENSYEKCHSNKIKIQIQSSK